MNNTEIIKKSLMKRHLAESRFKTYGILGIISATVFLIVILSTIFIEGKSAFKSTYIKLDVFFDPSIIDPDGTRDIDEIRFANYRKVIKNSLKNYFPEVIGKEEMKSLTELISSSEEENLMQAVLKNNDLIGANKKVWLKASSKIDIIHKNPEMKDLSESNRLISDKELEWFDKLTRNGDVKFSLNKIFFLKADSTEPEQAGILGSILGSFFTLVITLILSFPIAVAAGVFLEELAPKNRLTDIIEININNLAAVPSIVYGLLGLAVFINFFHLPRSAPLVGGLVLALMTLPRIIIPTRAAFASIPPSIREAALGVGASRTQVIMHHVLPLAMPGILTGTIIGLAQAAGETAPLLMIGMMAFIVDVPSEVTAKATVLPAQIYMWANNPERAFVARTSAGIVVLLTLLLVVNAAAIYFRRRFEKRW